MGAHGAEGLGEIVLDGQHRLRAFSHTLSNPGEVCADPPGAAIKDYEGPSAEVTNPGVYCIKRARAAQVSMARRKWLNKQRMIGSWDSDADPHRVNMTRAY